VVTAIFLVVCFDILLDRALAPRGRWDTWAIPPADQPFQKVVEQAGCSEHLGRLSELGYSSPNDLASLTSVRLGQELGIPSTNRVELQRLQKLIVATRGITDEVAGFLESIGLSQYISLFVEHGYSTLDDLLGLRLEDLASPGELPIPLQAHRKRILAALAVIRHAQVAPSLLCVVTGRLGDSAAMLLATVLWASCGVLLLGLLLLLLALCHPQLRPKIAEVCTIGTLMAWHRFRKSQASRGNPCSEIRNEGGDGTSSRPSSTDRANASNQQHSNSRASIGDTTAQSERNDEVNRDNTQSRSGAGSGCGAVRTEKTVLGCWCFGTSKSKEDC